MAQEVYGLSAVKAAFLDLPLNEAVSHEFMAQAFEVAGKEPPTKHVANTLYAVLNAIVRNFDPQTGERFLEGTARFSQVSDWSVRAFLAHVDESSMAGSGKKTKEAFHGTFRYLWLRTNW